MDPESVETFFGDKHRFPGIEQLKHIARVGVLVDVLPGGDLAKELENTEIIRPQTILARQCGNR